VFGALGWLLATLVVGWIPFLGGIIGTLLGLAVYLTVIAVQYDTDWVGAAAIAFVAWVSVLVARFFLARCWATGASSAFHSCERVLD